MPDEELPEKSSEIVFYQAEGGQSRIQVRLDGDTVWLSQRLMADLFQVAVPTINEHLANLFEEAELDPAATIRKFRIVQTEGKREVQEETESPDDFETVAKELGPKKREP